MAAKRAGRVRLVIDASVLRAAGESEVPASRRCRSFLEAVLAICHRLIASPELTAEWRRHRSRVGRRWLVQMYARRKVERQKLRSSLARPVERLEFSPAERGAVLKDLHLAELALQGDGRVVSLDEIARSLFAKAAASIAVLGALTWINPAEAGEEAIEWLEEMCPREPKRSLGHYPVGPER